MRKVMRYECKRLLWNRFFVGLVLVLLFYGWQVLGGTTILGVAHTAPFSPWSFGDYLGRMVPLLWVGVLFFLTFFTSPKARRVASLTDAAPMPPHRYALARCAAALQSLLAERRKEITLLPTLSLGSAVFSGEDVVTVKDRADRALYCAKNELKARAAAAMPAGGSGEKD